MLYDKRILGLGVPVVVCYKTHSYTYLMMTEVTHLDYIVFSTVICNYD